MESFLSVLFATYVFMLLAEFGDKTNLIALSLMTESNRPFWIALLSTIGIALSTVFSVIIGGVIGANFPLDPVRYITALIFIILGLLAIRGEEEEEHEEETSVSGEGVAWYKPIYLVALAEFGDKSQLLVITASAATFPLAIFTGATLGMATIMFLTAAFGAVFFDKIDEEKLEKIAALLFIAAGLWIGVSTYLS